MRALSRIEEHRALTDVQVEGGLASSQGKQAEAELIVSKGPSVVPIGIAGSMEAWMVHKNKINVVRVLVEVPNGLIAAYAEVEGHTCPKILCLAVPGICHAIHVPAQEMGNVIQKQIRK